MEYILNSIRNLDGVHGSFVFDSTSQLLTHSAHAVYDPTLLQAISQLLVKALDTVQLRFDAWDSVAVRYSDGWLMLRKVGPAPAGSIASGDVFLAVIADASLNLSFANVAVRVAIGKIQQALQSRGDLSPSSSNMSMGNPSPSMPGPAPFSMSSSSLHGPQSSSMSWSGFGSSMAGRSTVSVVDAEASAFLSTCARALAEFVGPMAKVFVKEAVRKVAGSAPFGAPHAQAVLVDLEAHIPDPTDRVAFRKNMGR